MRRSLHHGIPRGRRRSHPEEFDPGIADDGRRRSEALQLDSTLGQSVSQQRRGILRIAPRSNSPKVDASAANDCARGNLKMLIR